VSDTAGGSTAATGAGDHADDHADCEVVIGRMYQFLDSELPDADSDKIRQHLADCEPCLDQFDVEQAMKQLVNRCCRSETAPESLKAKLELGLLRARGL
jgi:mycothiol system anti-sigma-R factor